MIPDELWMQRCLDLAGLGFPEAFPNPLVGCVIVHQDKIIGEGYHSKYGDSHAEVNAIHSVLDKSLFIESTLYVNLEPCNHTGKTPPCTDLIIESGIKKVVVAATDPNTTVKGGGIDRLIKAGIKLSSGILEKEAQQQNCRFYTYHKQKRPYIILKWAQTSDGFIADENCHSKWISNENSRIMVHKWRTEEQAVLIGSNTAEKDNPRLTARLWKGKNPVRILFDEELKLKKDLHLFDQSSPTLIFNALLSKELNNLKYIQLDFAQGFLPGLLKSLYDLKIQSVIVEGGRITLQSFIDQGFWDEARIFISPKKFIKGISAPILPGKPSSIMPVGADLLMRYKNSSL
jgi:diaminohydroxyphosphoribosylaminopyrimidine deaminase / 5-amino-6-(5-phosphoribosylamino)uracil reductase